MSYERGMAAIRLEKTDRIPHTEYLDHDLFIKKITGLDTEAESDRLKIRSAIAKALDYDIIWNNKEMPLPAGARETSMGHAVYSTRDGQDNEVFCPFATEEDVLDFDPVAEYGLFERPVMVREFKEHFDNCQHNLFRNVVFPGGRYHTLFSACIRTFGWDMFLGSVYSANYEKFDRVLEGFFKISLAEAEAWAESGIEVFITHDDICWTSGAVFPPEWYRRYIFPRYKKIWEPLKEAGVKVLYCSDGTYTEFIDDIAGAGADGFILEPTTSLEDIACKYGKTKVIIGNMDCRVLQFGTKEDIYNEVKRCADIGKDCPGYFFAAGNHIPNGIEVENIEYYFECCQKLGKR